MTTHKYDIIKDIKQPLYIKRYKLCIWHINLIGQASFNSCLDSTDVSMTDMSSIGREFDPRVGSSRGFSFKKRFVHAGLSVQRI